MRQPKVSVNSKELLWFTLPFMPHIPALSHFLVGAVPFLCQFRELKQLQVEAGTVKKPLPAQSYSLPVSAPALTGLCVHHFNFSPFNCIFLWSHSSAKSDFQHSKCSSCAGPGTREEEGMTEQRRGEKSCPCSSSTAQDQHRSACKAQPCKAQLGCWGLPGKLSRSGAHLLPLCLRLLKGQQKAQVTTKQNNKSTGQQSTGQ